MAAKCCPGCRCCAAATTTCRCRGSGRRGLLLAAACDLQRAADDGRFRLPKMAIGIPRAWGGVQLLVRRLGPAVAVQLVLAAQSHDVGGAEEWCFVNWRVAVNQFDAAAEGLANNLAQHPALTLRATRRATRRRIREVAETLCTCSGSECDADDLRAAYRDARTLAVQRTYLPRHDG